MGTLYDSMANAVKEKYFRDSEGEVLQVHSFDLYEKHSGFSVRNVLTGEEGLVDILCSKEYEELSRPEVEIALSEREDVIKESKKELNLWLK